MNTPRVVNPNNDRASNGQRGAISEDIETLFKVEPPFTEVTGGFGFVGVVLYDKNADLLQCHICGRWVAHLPAHAWNAHKTKSAEYRKKFQLPLSYPLVSHAISGKIHDVNIDNELWKNFVGGKNRGQGGRKNNNAKYARTNASFQNKHGLCEKQIQERYVLVAEIVGREPTEEDVLNNDKPLLWAIKQRFTTFNKFKEQNGFQRYTFKKTAVGKLAENRGRITGSGCLGFLSELEKQYILKRFGSYRRAISYIGRDF